MRSRLCRSSARNGGKWQKALVVSGCQRLGMVVIVVWWWRMCKRLVARESETCGLPR